MTPSKVCYACERDLPLAAFTTRRKSPDGLAYECKECRRTYAKVYRQRRQAEIRAKQRAWTEANRDRVNEQALAWYRRNPVKQLVNVRIRQARLKSATCTCCTRKDFEKIYEEARRHGLEVDHVQPLSKGGKHCRLNLQLLSQHENRVKHAKWPEAA